MQQVKREVKKKGSLKKCVSKQGNSCFKLVCEGVCLCVSSRYETGPHHSGGGYFLFFILLCAHPT